MSFLTLQVAQPESSSDEEEVTPSSPRQHQESDSSLPTIPTPKMRKKKAQQKDLTNVLAELLTESRKELRQSQTAVSEVL
jgi:hypothetical protein